MREDHESKITTPLPTDRTLTVGQWLDRWLKAKVDANAVDRSTEVSYRGHIDKYLKPHLGHPSSRSFARRT
jgi:hypothetical protein